MIRVLNFAMLAIAIATCFGLYRIAGDAQAAQHALSETRADIEAEQEAITILRAEWSYLVKPARLQGLTERYLSLKAVAATEISTIARIPYRVEMTGTAVAPLDGVPALCAPVIVPRVKPASIAQARIG